MPLTDTSKWVIFCTQFHIFVYSHVMHFAIDVKISVNMQMCVCKTFRCFFWKRYCRFEIKKVGQMSYLDRPLLVLTVFYNLITFTSQKTQKFINDTTKVCVSRMHFRTRDYLSSLEIWQKNSASQSCYSTEIVSYSFQKQIY